MYYKFNYWISQLYLFDRPTYANLKTCCLIVIKLFVSVDWFYLFMILLLLVCKLRCFCWFWRLQATKIFWLCCWESCRIVAASPDTLGNEVDQVVLSFRSTLEAGSRIWCESVERSSLKIAFLSCIISILNKFCSFHVKHCKCSFIRIHHEWSFPRQQMALHPTEVCTMTS